MRRPCLDCGTPTTGSRCPSCRRAWDRTRRPSPAERGYTTEYRAARRQIIDAEPWCHSIPCPYPDAGTQANPLTADHVIPLRAIGPNLGLMVLCKRCNSAKGGRLGL